MSTTITASGLTTAEIDSFDDEPRSGVSWGAIFAGAAAAAAVAWLAFTQIAASAFGGYLAGRLRVRWVNIASDEVWFRDTAHGLLAWAVASVVTAAFLGSAFGGLLSKATQAGAEVAKGVAQMAPAAAGAMTGKSAASDRSEASVADGASNAYYVDMLYRSDMPPPADANDAALRAEAMRIFVNDMRSGSMGPADVRYLGQVVARRTGLPPADAEARVADTFKQASTTMVNAQIAAMTAADDARRAAATAALWTFVALLAGAFFASVAALVGGRQRDDRV